MDLYEPNPIWDDDFTNKTDTKKPFDLGRIIEREIKRPSHDS
jgi:hypothetical protein